MNIDRVDILEKIWNQFSSMNISNIIELDTKNKILIQNFISKKIDKTVFIKFTDNFENKVIKNIHLFDEININLIRTLINQKNKDFLMFEWINNAINKNYIKYDSFLSDKKVISRETFVIGNINFIKFYDNNEVYFVLQHINFIEGIYFPKRNLLVGVSAGGGIVLENIRLFMVNIMNNLENFTNYSNIEEKKFGGAIFSNGRPYHFLYNHIVAAQLLYQEQILQKLEYCISIKHELQYFDLTKIYPELLLKNKYLLTKSNKTMENAYQDKEFFLIATTRHNSDFWIDTTLKRRLISASIQNIEDMQYKELKRIEKSFPLIWIGVTGQKRSWKEQEEGYIKIINELSKEYPNIGIIFDGWTRSPYQIQNNLSKKTIDEDNKIIQKIILNLDDKIPTVNLVGKTPFEKIAFATVIDFFIVNHGTGSMYVSCIAEKIGVSHNSNKFRKIANKLHYHYMTYEVDQKNVFDQPSELQGVAEGDYSIDWKNVMNKLNFILKKFYAYKR